MILRVENDDCLYKPRIQSHYFDQKWWKLLGKVYYNYGWESPINSFENLDNLSE